MGDEISELAMLLAIYANRDRSVKDTRKFGVYFGWMGLVPENKEHATMIIKAKWGLGAEDIKPFAILLRSGAKAPQAILDQFYEMAHGQHKSGVRVTAQLEPKYAGDHRLVERNKERLDQRNTFIIAEFNQLQSDGETIMNAYSKIAEKREMNSSTVGKIVRGGSSFYPK